MVDGIEELGIALHSHDGQRSSLRRAHATHLRRQPVDSRIEDASYGAMSARTAPNLPLRPCGETARLQHLGMIRGAGHGNPPSVEPLESRSLGGKPKTETCVLALALHVHDPAVKLHDCFNDRQT